MSVSDQDVPHQDISDQDVSASASVPEDLAAVCPRALAERHRVVPLREDGDTLVVGAAHPLPSPARQEIAFATGRTVAVELVSEARIAACYASEHCYASEQETRPSSHASQEGPQEGAPQERGPQKAPNPPVELSKTPESVVDSHVDAEHTGLRSEQDAEDEALSGEPSEGDP